VPLYLLRTAGETHFSLFFWGCSISILDGATQAGENEQNGATLATMGWNEFPASD
jgi:hypothetical protein